MLFRIVLYAPILGIGGVIRVLQTDSSMTWILGLAVGLILVVIIVLFQVAMPKFTILQTYKDKPVCQQMYDFYVANYDAHYEWCFCADHLQRILCSGQWNHAGW